MSESNKARLILRVYYRGELVAREDLTGLPKEKYAVWARKWQDKPDVVLDLQFENEGKEGDA